MHPTDDYEVLKSNLLARSAQGKAPQCIAVTGCARRVGTSTVAGGLARVFARDTSRRVLLVDGNLRHPVLAKAAGLPNGTGISEFIHRKAALKEIVQTTAVDNLSLLTAGTPNGHHPSDLYAATRFKERLAKLKAAFDVIIWDAPALAPFADASLLVPWVDGVVLVVQAEKTRWEVARNAKVQLEKAHANILGVVLNRRRHVIPKLIYQHL